MFRFPIYFIITLNIFLLGFVAGCTDKEEKAQGHLQKGADYISNEDYNAAIIELRNAVQLLPKNAEARYKLGLAYLKTEDVGNAYNQLQRAASLDSTHIEANIKTAEVLLLTKNIEETKRYIDNILAQDPSNVTGRILNAKRLIALKQSEEAKTILTSIVTDHPDNQEAYLLIAHLYISENQLNKAEETLIQLLGTDTRTIAAHQQLVKVYLLQDNKAKAEESLQNMREIFPDSTEAKLGLAVLKSEQGKYQEAEQIIAESIAAAPEDEGVYLFAYKHYASRLQMDKAEQVLRDALAKLETPQLSKALLANLYFGQQRLQESEQLLREIEQDEELFPQATIVRVNILLLKNELVRAETIVDELLKNNPQWGEAHLLKSVIEERNNRIKSALASAETAVSYGMKNTQAYQQLANLYFREQEYDLARKSAETSLQIQPTNWKSNLILAQALLAQDNAEQALSILNELHAAMPASADILYTRGLAYMTMQDIDNAKSDFKKALGIAPESPAPLYQLVQIETRAGSYETTRKLLEQHANKTNNADQLALLGNFFLQNKKYDETREICSRIKGLAPKMAYPYLTLAKINVLENNPEKAEEEYRQLLESQPQNTTAMAGYAFLLEKKGNYSQASELYKKILDINPALIYIANNLAMLHTRASGDIGLALYYAKAAKEIAPEDPYIADTLGWVYYKRGSFRLAMNEFSLALEKLPENREIKKHYQLAETALARQEQKAEPVEYQTEGVGESLSIGNVGEGFKLE